MNEVIELAGCVILDEFGKVLLLHRSSEDVSQWELPGGKVESYEDPEETAVRELGEELGVEVRLLKLLGSAPFAIDDRTYHYTWFQAVIESGEPTVLEPKLFDDFDFFEIEDLPSLALSPNMLMLFEAIVCGEVELAA